MGNTMVEFFSEEMVANVCRYLNMSMAYLQLPKDNMCT